MSTDEMISRLRELAAGLDPLDEELTVDLRHQDEELLSMPFDTEEQRAEVRDLLFFQDPYAKEVHRTMVEEQGLTPAEADQQIDQAIIGCKRLREAGSPDWDLGQCLEDLDRGGIFF